MVTGHLDFLVPFQILSLYSNYSPINTNLSNIQNTKIHLICIYLGSSWTSSVLLLTIQKEGLPNIENYT